MWVGQPLFIWILLSQLVGGYLHGRSAAGYHLTPPCDSFSSEYYVLYQLLELLMKTGPLICRQSKLVGTSRTDWLVKTAQGRE